MATPLALDHMGASALGAGIVAAEVAAMPEAPETGSEAGPEGDPRLV